MSYTECAGICPEGVELEVDKRMHITSLYLKNIKCFEELACEFEDDKGASLVIAGDNGDGKSTILRSIAISLCDQWSAAGLLRELSGEFIRDGSNEEDGEIKLGLFISKNKRFEIITHIKLDSKGTYEYPWRKINQIYKTKEPEEIEDSDFDWERVFATAYGSGLRTVGTQDFQHYFTGDSVYSLFRDDVTLQNPELAIRRISTNVVKVKKSTKTNSREQIKIVQKALLAWLSKILMLSNKSLKVHGTGILVSGEGDGEGIPLAATGDGYKALTALILDMLSWWFLYRFNDKKITLDSLKEVNGVVIIDEIEQHLHPKLQSSILPSLKDHFPHVQFIVATHSPLVLSSSRSKALFLKNGRINERKLYGWLAEDVYTEMGKEHRRAPEVEEKLSEFNSLYRKKIEDKMNEEDEENFKRIYKQLKDELPPGDPVLETIKLTVMRDSLKDG